jgi:hypothetical protein
VPDDRKRHERDRQLDWLASDSLGDVPPPASAIVGSLVRSTRKEIESA